jgi:hypothetical protein
MLQESRYLALRQALSGPDPALSDFASNHGRYHQRIRDRGDENEREHEADGNDKHRHLRFLLNRKAWSQAEKCTSVKIPRRHVKNPLHAGTREILEHATGRDQEQ